MSESSEGFIEAIRGAEPGRVVELQLEDGLTQRQARARLRSVARGLGKEIRFMDTAKQGRPDLVRFQVFDLS